jgi:hypothetical protein
MQQNVKFITQTAVSKLKQQARMLKKAEGIMHHEALNRVAQFAGYSHWHAVITIARRSLPTELAYRSGLIFAFDSAESLDIGKETNHFVRDDMAVLLCADDIEKFYCEGEGVPVERWGSPADKDEWLEEEMSIYAFYRYTGTVLPSSLEEAITMASELFWSPIFAWHKGQFCLVP